MYRGNLSSHTFFNIFFFIREFSICSNLVGFNRINSIVILLNVQNQLTGAYVKFKAYDHYFEINDRLIDRLIDVLLV